jgi:hypothetical protein
VSEAMIHVALGSLLLRRVAHRVQFSKGLSEPRPDGNFVRPLANYMDNYPPSASQNGRQDQPKRGSQPPCCRERLLGRRVDRREGRLAWQLYPQPYRQRLVPIRCCRDQNYRNLWAVLTTSA